ncbi:hypothetical protein RAC89_29130 [Paenibacillus sp. GD4]|uniref:hypothetical protein n=1 Tax=Paenibacillus sp. GD4 TaxID=3068890 RepID=UPI0027968E83|nr:hypothetical protein [Paenibacillus sp. GD4]MDQ1914445.1 hypothetical protein [Paenibacillus sp. GD4]
MSPVSKKRKAGKKKGKQTLSISKHMLSKEAVKYICLDCEETEEIPLSVVQNFDMMDDGDPEVPPQFRCEGCGGEMYPEYYKGVHGYEYRIEDRLGLKEV